MNEKTIVAVDGSEQSDRAALWAAKRATMRGESLEIVRVLDDSLLSEDAAEADESRSEAEDELYEQCNRVLEVFPALPLTSRLVVGTPLDVCRALTAPDTLMVVGTHVRHGLRFRYHWSLGMRLAASAEGPVAIIPNRDLSHHVGVVTGVDGTDESIAAALYAAAEAHDLDEELQVVYAWLQPPLWQDAWVPDDAYLDALEARHAELLRRSVQKIVHAHPSQPITSRLDRRSAAWALIDRSAHAKLLVIGHRNRHGISGLLLGSTSQTVLLNLECPVIVYPLTASVHNDTTESTNQPAFADQ